MNSCVYNNKRKKNIFARMRRALLRVCGEFKIVVMAHKKDVLMDRFVQECVSGAIHWAMVGTL